MINENWLSANQEVITWHPGSEKPSRMECFLFKTQNMVWIALWTNEWFDHQGTKLDKPDWWAELPKGPQ